MRKDQQQRTRIALSAILYACVVLTGTFSLGMPAQVHAQGEPVRVVELRTEYETDPVGIDSKAPRMSWRLTSSRRGVAQTAYQIRVAKDLEGLTRAPIWDSGIVRTDASIHRPYNGPALESGERYVWQARAWDERGRATSWSKPASWEMGMLSPAEWQANWITTAIEGDTALSSPSPLLRTEFQVDGKVASARAYVASLGLNQMEVNGNRVGDRVLTPGWTPYSERLEYHTYDVTELLRPGTNAVGLELGGGWYRGRISNYGPHLGALAQIVIRYADGREQVVGTDERWKATMGPVRFSDIWDGEIYDARMEKPGWSRAGFDDSGWTTVRLLNQDKDVLVAPVGPPVRRIQEVKPVEIIRTPAGELVFDFGQNMVGWVRLKVDGPRGSTVRMRHAEVLDKDGNFYTANLRSAKQTNEYTLKGTGEEVYEPRFTFQGFRYVAVDGYPGDPTIYDLTGVVIHSDMPRTGAFETSDTLLNQLQQNIVWGQKGNFVDIPTDTPARDERLGWTGDAQAFSPTAAFNFNVANFFTRWLRGLSADQGEAGNYPVISPLPPHEKEKLNELSRAAGWSDAGVIIPWDLYLAYGDERVLAEQYESMKAWVEFVKREAGEDLIWNGGWQFGDWLAFATTRPDYPGATTDKDLIATAFYAHSADLLSRIAGVLGKTEDARTYSELFGNVKRAFNSEFVTSEGRLASNTQTAYALALQFGLLPEPLRAEAARRLAEDVREFKHLTTGFLGTPHLNYALSENGYLDEAYMLLMRKEYPSWLYPVTRGATTVWERWDGIKPDSTFQDVGMNSFNHYAYGAVGDWMYQTLAGLKLDPRAPGYKHSFIEPRPGVELNHVRASLETMYGTLGSAWEHRDGHFQLTATVPANTSATVRLPGAEMGAVTESGKPVRRVRGVRRVYQDGPDTVVEIGSGTYRFTYPRLLH